MKAVIWSAYGTPERLSVQDVMPPVPKPNQVLIQVHVSTVTAGDCRMRGLNVPAGFGLLMRLAFGLFKPRKKIPGMDFAGEVIGIGDQVTQFQIGDRVFGSTGMALGAHAQYLCMEEHKALVKLPDGLSYTDGAALIFGGTTALHFLQERIKPDMQVLINGASGAVGSAAVQLCKTAGARVTGVCSGANAELVLGLGADVVIDYTRQDFTQNGAAYDLILDAVGNLTYVQCKSSLQEAGQLILINADLKTILGSVLQPAVVCGVAEEGKALLVSLLAAYQCSRIKPVIDRVYALEEIVEAHRYVDTGRKRGSVVLQIK